jgi:hypothetical protein
MRQQQQRKEIRRYHNTDNPSSQGAGGPIFECSGFAAQRIRAEPAWAESPAGVTLPEVAKYPLRNNVPDASAAWKPELKDTKPKGFSP